MQCNVSYKNLSVCGEFDSDVICPFEYLHVALAMPADVKTLFVGVLYVLSHPSEPRWGMRHLSNDAFSSCETATGGWLTL